MRLREITESNELFLLDGSMGVYAIKLGINPKNILSANITDPEVIQSIHKGYVRAGSRGILTNTFNLTEESACQSGYTQREIIKAAVENARKALEGYDDGMVLFDMSPSGFIPDEQGDFPEAKALELYGAQAAYAREYGVDGVFIETIAQAEEMACAIRAVKENTTLPVFASMTFNAGGTSWYGSTIEDFAQVINELKPDCAGINCSIAPRETLPLLKRLSYLTDIPLCAKPNRGRPVLRGSETVYEMTPEEYASDLYEIYRLGIRILGGCCGTDEQCLKLFAQKVMG
ncbi:MAG: hypothetical protein GX061_07755 [Eubacteriaceae bacterium]|nr:hypothetical protein [Eubacteriaceae bacterium]